MRILVVQTAYLGDAVLTTPLLRELVRARPEARLTLLATGAGAQALRGFPGVERVLEYDKRWSLRGLVSELRTFREVAAGRFDAAIAAQRSFRTGQILWMTRARLRVGFAGAAGAFAYHARVAWEPGRHAARRYLDLSAPLGGDPDAADPRPSLAVPAAAREWVARTLTEVGVRPDAPLVAIAPGSARPTKRWLPAGFAELARAAARRGLVPVLAGGSAERASCAEIAAAAGGLALDLCGRTDVARLAALLARASAVVANDSGAAHVAAAVGTPCVVVYGPTSPAAGYAPLGAVVESVAHPDLDCRPCSPRGPRTCPRGHFRCMSELEPPNVVAALDRALAARAGPPAQLASGVRPG
jgi:heptosyltransferase-2